MMITQLSLSVANQILKQAANIYRNKLNNMSNNNRWLPEPKLYHKLGYSTAEDFSIGVLATTLERHMTTVLGNLNETFLIELYKQALDFSLVNPAVSFFKKRKKVRGEKAKYDFDVIYNDNPFCLE